MTKKILIFGGTGFVGFHLIKNAKKLQYKVTSISLHKPKKIRKVIGVKYISLDLSKKKNLLKINFNTYDYIINCLGHVDHKNKIKTYETHFIFVKRVCKILKKTKIKKFIQIGSSLEYGNLKAPHSENSKMNPKYLNSYYARSKLLATNYLLNLYKYHKFPVIIVRPYLLYGPNQDMNRLIPIVIKNCLSNSSFDCSNGNQLRNFLYIDDFVKVLFFFLKKKNYNYCGQIFNIGSIKSHKVKDVIKKIVIFCKAGKPLFGKINLRKDEVLRSFPDIKKVSIYSGIKLFIPLDLGLKKTINFYRKFIHAQSKYNS